MRISYAKTMLVTMMNKQISRHDRRICHDAQSDDESQLPWSPDTVMCLSDEKGRPVSVSHPNRSDASASNRRHGSNRPVNEDEMRSTSNTAGMRCWEREKIEIDARRKLRNGSDGRHIGDKCSKEECS